MIELWDHNACLSKQIFKQSFAEINRTLTEIICEEQDYSSYVLYLRILYYFADGIRLKERGDKIKTDSLLNYI